MTVLRLSDRPGVVGSMLVVLGDACVTVPKTPAPASPDAFQSGHVVLGDTMFITTLDAPPTVP